MYFMYKSKDTSSNINFTLRKKSKKYPVLTNLHLKFFLYEYYALHNLW